MKFNRTVTTTLTAEHQGFTIRITNRTDDPEWVVALIDYDHATAAMGLFATEEEAKQNIEGFLALALPAYAKKYAKYGEMPLIRIRNGELTMVLEPVADPQGE